MKIWWWMGLWRGYWPNIVNRRKYRKDSRSINGELRFRPFYQQKINPSATNHHSRETLPVSTFPNQYRAHHIGPITMYKQIYHHLNILVAKTSPTEIIARYKGFKRNDSFLMIIFSMILIWLLWIIYHKLIKITKQKFKQMNAVNHSMRALKIYREYFVATAKCQDRPLKLYIRRRIREDYRQNINAPTETIEGLLNKAEEELKVVKRQMAIRQLYEYWWFLYSTLLFKTNGLNFMMYVSLNLKVFISCYQHMLRKF